MFLSLRTSKLEATVISPSTRETYQVPGTPTGSQGHCMPRWYRVRYGRSEQKLRPKRIRQGAFNPSNLRSQATVPGTCTSTGYRIGSGCCVHETTCADANEDALKPSRERFQRWGLSVRDGGFLVHVPVSGLGCWDTIRFPFGYAMHMRHRY